MEKVFVYGTLRKSEIRKQVTGRTIPIGIFDKIQGFELSTVNYGKYTYPALMTRLGSKEIVEGEIIDVTENELIMLDQYEGELYQRKKVILESGIEAWVYVGLE